MTIYISMRNYIPFTCSELTSEAFSVSSTAPFSPVNNSNLDCCIFKERERYTNLYVYLHLLAESSFSIGA